MDTMNNDKIKMKHFRKWAEDKNPSLAAIALTIAGLSKVCFEISESVQKGKRIEGDIPLPSLKTWLKLYHKPKRIRRALLNALGNINDDTAKKVDALKLLLEGARQMQNSGEKYIAELKKIPPDEIQKMLEDGKRKLEEDLELVINDFVSEPTEKEGKEFINNMPKSELIFFIRVLVPCFSLYGIYPVDLLRQAQSGDDEALEKIIRLDKSSIFEPKISGIIHQAQAMKEQARMTMIKKAFVSKPKATMNMKTIKCHLGGLISYLSELLRQKLIPSDIKKLYNAIAQDLRIDMHDQDLHNMTVPTFAKRINRTHSMWKFILNQDKK
jgi:hypothetical protein